MNQLQERLGPGGSRERKEFAMPTSDNITVPVVSEIVKVIAPESALDIGVGAGKFGFIFREEREWKTTSVPAEHWRTRLDGVEVCSGYITPLHKYLYDELYIGLAQEVVPTLGSYDLIYMGDVIEHLSKSEGRNLLEVLYDKAKMGILVVTPVGEYPQQGAVENPYQEHKSVWHPRDFARCPWRLYLKVGGRQWVIFISKSQELLRTVQHKRRRHILDGYLRRHRNLKLLLHFARRSFRMPHSRVRVR